MKAMRAGGIQDIPDDCPLYIFGAATGGWRLITQLKYYGYGDNVVGFIDDVASSAPDGYSLQTSAEFLRGAPTGALILVASAHFEKISCLFENVDVTLYDTTTIIKNYFSWARTATFGARGGLPAEWSTADSPVFGMLLRLVDSIQNWAPALRTIPSDMVAQLTMGGRIPIRDFFRDDTCLSVSGEGEQTRIRLNLETMIYSRLQVDEIIHLARMGGTFHYGDTDTWLYAAFATHPIAGKDVAILGSGCPVYEGICLAYGGIPVTVEYSVRLTDDSRLRFMSPQQFAETGPVVTAAISVSSFEHDGLGRYGDPLDADGDLKAMASLTRRMAPDGLLYLTVPFQHDAVIWNVNRHYGPIRLPLLLQDWTLIAVFGPPEGLFVSLDPLVIDAQAWHRHFEYLGPGKAPEWVLVLRNDRVPGSGAAAI
jgi:hypothetical protein